MLKERAKQLLYNNNPIFKVWSNSGCPTHGCCVAVSFEIKTFHFGGENLMAVKQQDILR